MIKYLKFSILATAIILLYSCNKSSKPTQMADIHPDMGMYISAFSSGHLAHNQSIEIYFTGDFVDTTRFKSEFLSFEPQQSGSITWPSAGVLRFIPDTSWQRNTFYTAKLSLNEFLDVPEHVSQLNFQFYIPDIQLEVKSIFIEEAENGKQKAKIFFDLSEEVSYLKLLPSFSVEFQSRKLELNLLQDAVSRQPMLETEAFELKGDKQTLTFEWDLKSLDSKSKGKETFLLPNNKDFTVFKTRVHHSDKPIIEVNFTQKLKSNFDYSGLIALNRLKINNYEINGNTLRIFLDQKLSGNQYLELYKGFASTKSTLQKNIRIPLDFGIKLPKVTWLNQGSILPLSSSIRVAFKAENLKSVNLKVLKLPEGTLIKPFSSNQDEIVYLGDVVHEEKLILSKLSNNENSIYAVELDQIIATEPGALYHIQMSYDQSDADLPCVENQKVRNLKWPSKSTEYNDFYEYYDYKDRNNPCTPSYYSPNKFIGKLILASDLGIMAKLSADNEVFASVQDLKTTEALKDVTLTVYNKKQQQIGKGVTDGDGVTRIVCKDVPNYIVAQKERQRNYLSLESFSYLSTYKFDVGGQSEETNNNGFAYTERGVWRPGDTIHLSYLPPVNGKNKIEDYPTRLEVFDPQNRLVYSKVLLKPEHQIFHFPIPINKNALTGTYRSKIRFGQEELSHLFKVENIRPERLRLKAKFPEGIADFNAFPIAIAGKVEWLMGMKAQDLRIQIKGIPQGRNVYFDQYKDFHFNNDTQDESPRKNLPLASTKTDEKGNFILEVKNPSENLKHPVIQTQCEIQAFEKGGEFTTLLGTFSHYNYEHFTGIQADGRWTKGDTVNIPIVVVDSKQQLVKNQKVKIEVIFRDMERYWSLRNSEGVFNEEIADKTLYSSTVELNSGKGSFPLYINAAFPDYVRIKVTNLENAYISSTQKYLYSEEENNYDEEEEEYYEEDYTKPFSDNAPRKSSTPVTFQPQLSKDSVKIGDQVIMSFEASEGAKVLLSYEVGSKVVKQEFLKTQLGINKINIKVDASMSPGVYLHTTLIQPYAQSENDQPIRLYGIAYLKVNDPNLKLQPEIITPKESAPNQTLKVQIKEKEGKTMNYTLALVDEGLLSLTRFKTPNPYSFFNSKKALQVKTWDNYAHILGAYSGIIERLYAIGGGGYDDEMTMMKSANQDPDGQRFEPMVRFLGPFHLDAKKTATHEVTIPNYIGSLRLMVIAREGKAFGSAENEVKINQDLMVQMSFPKKMAPQEEVFVPVEVFNRGTKNLDVQLVPKLKGQVKLGVQAPKSIQVQSKSSKIVYLPLKTLNAGTLEIEIQARSEGKTSVQKIFAEVLHPFGPVQEFTHFSIEQGKSKTLNINTLENEKRLNAQLEINSFGSLQLSSRLNYLISYPHGCTEQILSKVRAQVALLPLMNPTTEEVKLMKKNLQTAINEIYKRQNGLGDFSYWSGAQQSDAFISIYTLLVLHELQKAGIAVNNTVYNKALQRQSTLANQWIPNSESPIYQSFRLYVLSKAARPQAAAMNRMRQSKLTQGTSHLYLTLAYAYNGQRKEALGLKEKSLKTQESDDYFQSNNIMKALQMELSNVLALENESQKIAQEISETINNQQYLNTYETASLLNSISPHFAKNQTQEAIKGNWTAGSKSENFNFRTGAQRFTIPNDASQLKINNLQEKSKLNGMLTVTKTLPYSSDQDFSENMAITLKYFDENGQPIEIQKLKQGTDVYVEIEVNRAASFNEKEHFALTFYIPSGWEFYNPRLNSNTESNNPSIDYQDFRDDKILTYFNLKNNNNLKLQFRFNAAFPGKYYFGAAEASHMYQNNARARVKGFWIEVE